MEADATTKRLDYIVDLMKAAVEEVQPLRITGRVLQVTGMLIKAVVPNIRLQEICILSDPETGYETKAEVIGFTQDAALLTPLAEMVGISTATEVIPTGDIHKVRVGDELIGRVLDGLGNPIDISTKGPLTTDSHYPVYADSPDPLSRQLIQKPVAMGVRVLDGLLTCGEGQRMGVFAAAGVGKSTLLAMLVKYASVDVTVVALIGERGREVREFIENDLGPEGMKRAVLVVATSDKSSMERSKAAFVATAIAEYFRDKGKSVLLLMDSVTRFARAQREIGLAAGEPPTRRGFPPSVFATMPKLMERAGMSDAGSITAFYTVLVEGDDMEEPVADEVRSILDGHIVLSRKLASANHYPAVDVLASISRVMNHVVDESQIILSNRIRELMARYDEIELLVRIGEYAKGSDPLSDEALAKHDAIIDFLRQKTTEHVPMSDTISQMDALVRRSE